MTPPHTHPAALASTSSPRGVTSAVPGVGARGSKSQQGRNGRRPRPSPHGDRRRGERAGARPRPPRRPLSASRRTWPSSSAPRLPRSARQPLWQSRCCGGRIVVSPEHDDFPAILAEALDVLATHALDTKRAAEVLGCTPTQLTRFLKIEPRALRVVNDQRRAIGLHTLQ